MVIVSVIGCMYLCTSFKMMSFCDSLLGNFSTRMKTLILLVLALRIVPAVYAQEYCGYPEVYKLTKVTLDTSTSAIHRVVDVLQNQRGVWTIGYINSSTSSKDSNGLLITRFNDTGKLEWHLRLDVNPHINVVPKMASTDDQGVIVIGNTQKPNRLTHPWIANISPNGTLRWMRDMNEIPGVPSSAILYNVEVKYNGEIWAVGYGGVNGVYMPILIRLNRFGNLIDGRAFIEPTQTLPYVTQMHRYKDVISWGNLNNQMLIAGEYQAPEPTNTLQNSVQPVLSIFDSLGGFVRNIFFQSQLLSSEFRVNKVVRSTRHPSRVFLVGSLTDYASSSLLNGKSFLWAACVDVDKDSVIWQNTYDTIESWAQRAYFDRDRLIVLYKAKRPDGIIADGIMQLDSLGNWEFVHHVKVGDQADLHDFEFKLVRSSYPLRDGGLVLAGNTSTLDTAHLLMVWTKPCDPDFCTNIAYTVKSKKTTDLFKRATKGHSEFNISISNNSPVQSQLPYVYQSMSCRYCPLPIINVSDVILCDFPLFHQQDVWDIYSKVTWNDGDNSKFKTFDRVGQYWLMKQNACGISRDTFRIFKENRPVKVLNDNEYFCRGRLFTLKATQPNPGNFTYRWSDGSTSPELNVYGTKTVTLTTNSNGCGSRTDVVNVYEVNCDCEICVPNSITPYNADGVNDEWLPRTDCKYDNCKIKEGSYRIYNRWGEKIAENPITVAWNGTDFKGDFVPRGVYVYNIKIIFDESVEGNRIINENGDITVW